MGRREIEDIVDGSEIVTPHFRRLFSISCQRAVLGFDNFKKLMTEMVYCHLWGPY
jgi:hypothetical protein